MHWEYEKRKAAIRRLALRTMTGNLDQDCWRRRLSPSSMPPTRKSNPLVGSGTL